MSDCMVAAPPGIGRRRLKKNLKPRLTRHLVWVCLNIALLRDPVLHAKAERELGYGFFR